MADDLSSALEEIRAEADGDIAYHAGHDDCPDTGSSCSAHNALRLLAAVEAVLADADDWERAGADYVARADRAAAASLPGTAARLGARGETFQECAAKVREAISREITRKGGSDERGT